MTYQKRRAMTGYLFLLPYALSFTCFLLLPILVAMGLSIVQYDLATNDTVRFVGFQNFVDVWKDEYFWKALSASWWFVYLMVPVLLVTGLAMALGLNSMARGKQMARALIFLPGLFNIAVTGILWQWFYNQEFGLFNFILKTFFHHAPVAFLGEKANAMPSIVAMSMWWTVGGTSVVLLAALQQIPRMYIEAAALDGAGVWQIFTKVTMPHLKPVLIFVMLTSTIGAFQMFPQASLLTQGGPELATRGVVQYIYESAFNNYRLGYAAALSWMLTLIIVVFSLVQFAILRRNSV